MWCALAVSTAEGGRHENNHAQLPFLTVDVKTFSEIVNSPSCHTWEVYNTM